MEHSLPFSTLFWFLVPNIIIVALSLSDFFENRFQDDSRSLRVVTAIMILIFFTIYVSSGLVAGGMLFETIFQVNYTLAVYLSVLVIGLYTFLGGFLAVENQTT